MDEERSFIGFFKRLPKRAPVGPTVTYGEANTRTVEPIGGQDAPDPVRQSDTLARAARMPRVVFTNIPGIHSVMFDFFAYPLFAPSPHAHYLLGPGGQLTWDERSNIQTAQSEPYGSTFEMPSHPDAYTGVYSKLL